MSIFGEYREYILPLTIGIVIGIIMYLFLVSTFPEIANNFVAPIVIGLLTSAIWYFIVWFFYLRRIKKMEEFVKETVFERLHPHISGFIDKIVTNFTRRGEKTEEFYKRIENHINEHPTLFQDCERRINRFKAICSDDLLPDFIDTMRILDNDSWDDMIQASKQLKEDLFILHIYLPYIPLKYTKTIIKLTTKLEYFTRRMNLLFEQWKESSEKDDIKPFVDTIKSFQRILKLVDEFMTPLRHFLGLDREETT